MQEVEQRLPAVATSPALRRQRWRQRSTWAPVLLLTAAAAALLSLLTHSRLHAQQQRFPVQLNSEEPSDQVESAGAVGALLGAVEGALQPLQEQVASGHVVPKFGERAQAVLSSAMQQAGSAGAEIERTVDAMLQSLFLRQLAIVRQQTAEKVRKEKRLVEAVAQADQLFVAQAEELRRPGSTWSYDQERYALRAILEGGFRRDLALAEERVMAAEAQQSTVEVISKLQAQMENLQQRVQHLRSGSPWFLSSSYRIPGTPVQLIGRYQQGRGSIEVNLSPDRDPANAEAGFTQGVGPANIGINGNLGM
ncbi:unnamed protein product [Polarella glacialis]|uniref:Uncharacterized protein n=1 Tax=Polarella glacialis TaxID=89957 RepID=A0A813JAY2_POLGL|nr:unnamed protein product [Polarella glacialis]CAE8678050.1 unnamed protein product [Polarella glacialis]